MDYSFDSYKDKYWCLENIMIFLYLYGINIQLVKSLVDFPVVAHLFVDQWLH